MSLDQSTKKLAVDVAAMLDEGGVIISRTVVAGCQAVRVDWFAPEFTVALAFTPGHFEAVERDAGAVALLAYELSKINP